LSGGHGAVLQAIGDAVLLILLAGVDFVHAWGVEGANYPG
jgi:hypothetical protein